MVDGRPSFGDSISVLLNYIQENLNYPNTKNDVGGRVYVRFVVEPDGSLTRFKVLRKLAPEFDYEAIEVLKNMPKWSPGKCNGIHVPVYFVLPVYFKIFN